MKKLYISAGVCAVLVLIGAVFAQQAHANPSVIARSAQTSSSTTTPVFMQAATATTTVVIYDSYGAASTAPWYTKATDAVLLLQVGATTTPVVNVVYEYANDSALGYDCTVVPTGCDWYSDNIAWPVARTAASVNFPNMYTLTLASASSSVALYVPTPTRYVRVRVKSTASAASFWGQIVPNKEAK